MKHFFKLSMVFSTFLFSIVAQANQNQWLGVGQGISNPSSLSTINFSNGFNNENPVGVTYQQSGRITAQGDWGSNNSSGNGVGGELGFGNGSFGIAGGYYQNSCNNCDGRWAGAIGASLNIFALGVRFSENVNSAGLIFNPNGNHRFGLLAELNKITGSNNDITSLGAGYTYVGSQFRFTLDASKLSYENTSLNDDTIMLSPGLAFFLRQVSFSMTYNLYLNKQVNSTYEDQFWFGVGFGKQGVWTATVYHKYVNDWSAALSFYF